MSAFHATSEIAYDLLREHYSVLLMLLAQPYREEEIIARLGSATALERLVRHGLVVRDGGYVRAVAERYELDRQENMMTFLEQYVMAELIAGVDGSTNATLESFYLRAPPNELDRMYARHVEPFFNRLAEISEGPSGGASEQFTAVVIGTSAIPKPEEAPQHKNERALYYLKLASLQRANPDMREQAMLSQLDGLMDEARALLCVYAATTFIEGFAAEQRDDPSQANYHFTVATLRRPAPQVGGAVN